jgi:hypothetical protein
LGDGDVLKETEAADLVRESGRIHGCETGTGVSLGQDGESDSMGCDGRENKDTFENQDLGCPAKPCRMAIGTLIIKEKYGVSDIETAE